MCHVNAGSEPWNAYGWSIREEIQGGADAQTAIQNVEFDNSDGDPIGAHNFDEILRNFQPGWTAGANNTHYFKNGSTTSGHSPPPVSTTTDIDFPSVAANPIPTTIPAIGTMLDLEEIAGGFNAPVRAVKAPGINGSLFVVEQTGKIFRVDLDSGEKTLFHDVGSDLIATGERGLLGMAFHPDFTSNGLFYTYQSEPVHAEQDSEVDFSTIAGVFTPDHRSMVVEYKAADPSCNSSISKSDTLMIIDQPQPNHNGGDLAFDQSNLLYIPLGDGGGSGDVGPGHSLLGTGRDNENVYGSILRIDPLGDNSVNGRYGIPASNPFVGEDGEDEIFAYGFRNPFRISFDSTTGDLYAGDVGQHELEEIDLVVNGGNYGWNWKEGSFFFYNPESEPRYVSDVASPGAPIDLVDPIGEYDHDDGKAVIGGYIYRGTTINGSIGDYVFADYAGPSLQKGRVFTMDPGTGVISEFTLTSPVPGFITGFGEDSNNELYIVTNDELSTAGVEGKLLKLVETGDTSVSPDGSGEAAQCPPSDDFCVPIKGSNGKVSLICL